MGVTELTTRLLGAESTEDRAQRLPEYGTELPPGIDGDWDKRILALRDSLSVQEIIRVLYQEQLDRGAGLAGLGTWKSYFDQSVMETIARLAGNASLRAAPGGVLESRIELATTAKRKRTKAKERKAASDKSVERTPAPSRQAEMEATSSPGTAQGWATAGGASEPESHNGFGDPGEAGEAAPPRRGLATAFVALVVRIVQRRMFGVDGQSVAESRAGRG